MKFAENFYFSDNILNRTLTLNLLSRHVYPAGLFVVTLSEKSDELLTIYSAEEFQKPHMIKNDSFIVVGVARTKLSAEKLCSEILADCYEEDKELDLYKFFGFENFRPKTYEASATDDILNEASSDSGKENA